VTLARPALARPAGLLAGLMALVLAFAWVGAAFAAQSGPKFPPLSGRVVDQAHLLSPDTTQKLDGALAGLEAKTGHQLVVATVPDLQGYPIEDYGYRLGRTWQLGRKGVNDGVILLVAPNDRKVRIEVGYGLEPVLTDALSSVILQEDVLPAFRSGHMEQGVIDGTNAIIKQLSLPDDQAKAQVASAEQQQARQASRPVGHGGSPPIPVVFVIIFVVWILSRMLRGRGGGLWWLPFMFMGGGGGGWRGGDGGGFGGGGFSGGGGSFGGGGSSGSW
jgi:uncharacterized protein